MNSKTAIALGMVLAFGAGPASPPKSAAAPAQSSVGGVPRFEVDPYWPKMDGNWKSDWILGSIGGVAVDPANDHVWVVQRPSTLDKSESFAAENPPVADCCAPAPPVLEFDPEGNLVQAWGGPGTGYDWPQREHGITVDYKGNVWIAGAGKKDNQVLKFTKSGKFLLQIGHPGQSTGSEDTQNFDEPTQVAVDAKTNEAFIADGYVNRRVIVVDADTGAFHRLWGAYGHKPDDSAPRIRRFPFERPQDQAAQTLSSDPAPQQFNLVHAVVISSDGLVYVAERSNNRIQVFRPDGTFVKEAFVARDLCTPSGSTGSLALSADPQQKFLYVTGGDDHIRILDRDTLQVVSTIGHLGHYAGQFFHLHVIAVDTKGNIYVGENTGKRVQKLVFKGLSAQ